MKVLVVENSDRVPVGRLGPALDAAGVETVTVALWDGQMPERRPWDGIVVLGGHMGAYDTQEYSWLGPEMAFMRWALDEAIPLLGVCLGSQLTAHAAGGRAFLGPMPEVGFIDLRLTDPGRTDPVIGQIDGPVLAVHRDTFDMPAGATLLASSDRYPHAFRYGSALGIQFHPEADLDIAAGWVDAGGLGELADAAGTTLEAFLDEVAAQEEAAAAMAKRLFGAWLTSDVL